MLSKTVWLLYLLAVSFANLQHSLAPSPATDVYKATRTETSTDVQVAPASFEASAGLALLAMKGRAEELKIGVVTVLAYFEGDKIESWSSKMLVVGRMKDDPTANDKGSNLLGIAYAKAAEMADTLKNSGSKVRPPISG